MGAVSMVILIDQPELYYCKDDENHFFQWLYGIPAYEKVRGTPHGLEISLRDPIDKDSLYRLIGLLKRYSIDMKPLKALNHSGVANWFEDDIMYWHSDIFGASGDQK
jgi:hypothetical protein